LPNSIENKNQVISYFPELANDKFFKIEDDNPNYNCIAWAAHITNCWWDNLPRDKRPTYRVLDGIKVDWPFDVDNEFSTKILIEIFTKLRYIKCVDGNYEKGYKKVAIYEKNGKATHMARQLTYGKNKGLWSSKLGSSFRILHESSKSIEGNIYGHVEIFMRTRMS